LLTRCLDISGYVGNTVDIFNVTSGVWTTAALSVARGSLTATSLPNDGLAIFAGGYGASYVFMSVIAGGWCVGREEIVREGRSVLVPLLLVVDALRRCTCHAFQYC
jgi:hypothetical protein